MISVLLNCPTVASYLNRVGAEFKSMFSAIISRSVLGYEKEVVRIKFNKSGEVFAPDGYEPTPQEASAIASEVANVQFPTIEKIKELSPANSPDLINQASNSDLFIFRDREGQIEFIQVRVALEDGDKRYVPQTYWSDGVWRAAEPEDGLPLYNGHKVEAGDRVFLHEGAKAARGAEDAAKDPSHPWHSFLRTGVHVGWVGGAHYVGKSRWEDIHRLPSEVIIVPDNDFVGMSKTSQIAKRFSCSVAYCQLDSNWPHGWDLADPFPKDMFSPRDGVYLGPKMEQQLRSCDWATQVIGYKGRNEDTPIFGIREEFARNWVRVQKLRHYAHVREPDKTLDKDQFNAAVRPYSDVTDTAALLSKVSGTICDSVTFLPNKPSGLIMQDGELCLNQYIDSRIDPVQGDTSPFWKFLDYLIPIESERYQVARWMATLYAKPDVRMGYALLLLSKLQGVGKSTLLDMCAELVGKRHTSFPGDAMIQSDFNTWMINKRLVVVHEIYAGQTWKTYNRLKSFITDENVEANTKHVANYTLPNWTHFAAASNSLEALRMEHDDRRWFVPTLPGHPYDSYGEVRAWMAEGGLKALAYEFLNRDDYVGPGEIAPRTAAKRHLIDQSMPADERMVLIMAERLEPTACLDVKDAWLWLQNEARTRAFVSPQRIVTLLREHGFHVEEPVQVGARERQMIWRSKPDKEKAVNGADNPVVAALSFLKDPSEVFRAGGDM